MPFIVCHGCKKVVKANIIKQYMLDKNINPNKQDNPIYPLFTTLQIEDHKKGWFKPRCNRSRKTIKLKGKYIMEDEDDYMDIGLKQEKNKRYF